MPMISHFTGSGRVEYGGSKRCAQRGGVRWLLFLPEPLDVCDCGARIRSRILLASEEPAIKTSLSSSSENCLSMALLPFMDFIKSFKTKPIRDN